jgi:phosphate/phosphite/phosphonate ABC transporter binding protein
MRWWQRLEVRVLLLATLLPLFGIVSVSFGVLHLMRQGLLTVARQQSESTAEIITRSVERVMKEGRADITRALVEDLRAHSGIAGVDVLNDTGREAFTKSAEAPESAALERLRANPVPYSEQSGERLLFYRPLLNGPECRSCHGADKTLLGATKISIPLREVFQGGSSLVAVALAWSLAGVLFMGLLLWWLIRMLVVRPVTRMREATAALAVGDLTVDLAGHTSGDLGLLWESLRDSIRSLGAVILRIHEVSRRVAAISARTEQESATVVDATTVETDSFAAIASSIEQLGAAIGQISEDIEGLSVAADTVHAAAREMAVNTGEVHQRSEELAATVAEVSQTIGEMTHTIRELTWGTEHLSGVSTETLAAVHEVDEVIRAVGEGARESAASSARVRREAEELGLRAVRRTLEGMEAIRAAVDRGAGAVQTLGQRSVEIGEILTVIDEVNDRTGLLSLNAAILAAQAGEHGRGFQVVAGEIRSLAVKTARSTVEIASLINAVRTEVAQAVEAMRAGRTEVEAGFGFAREAGAALEKIVESSGISLEKANSIQEAAQTQSRGLVRVRETMGRLDQMAQFLAQGTTEQKREAEKIRGAMDHLAAAAQRITAANGEQALAGNHVATAAERVSEGIGRMSHALAEQREGCRQIRLALVPVVDLPRSNRVLALRINQGLRGINSDTELLEAEVSRFTVLPEESRGALRFGIVPLESPARMHRRFTPLAEYLGRTLGRPVELKVALDFDEAVRDLGEGRTQFAYLTPSTYVLAHDRFGAVLLATALRRGKPFQHAAIICRRDARLGSLAELKGRSFAFGDVNSTSSHIVPRAMLLEAGVGVERLGSFEHLGHHDAVAAAVLRGDYDAGAVMESVAAQYAAEGLMTLVQSPPIPEFNICAAKELPGNVLETLRSALLALTRDDAGGAAVLEALYPDYTGFARSSDADYASIRLMMRKLGLLEQPPA